jgi:hypothetical protein
VGCGVLVSAPKRRTAGPSGRGNMGDPAYGPYPLGAAGASVIWMISASVIWMIL